MQLPAAAQNVYKEWWSLASYAAANTSPSTGQLYSSSDLNAAAADVARAQGAPLAFTDFTGLTTLYSIARTIERAADTLTAAADSDALHAGMVSEAPWSRSAHLQAASPMWQLRAQITYRAPDGTVITSWGTGIFQNVLPSTAGALRAEAELQFARMLAARNEQRNTGGELLSIGRTYLMAV